MNIKDQLACIGFPTGGFCLLILCIAYVIHYIKCVHYEIREKYYYDNIYDHRDYNHTYNSINGTYTRYPSYDYRDNNYYYENNDIYEGDNDYYEGDNDDDYYFDDSDMRYCYYYNNELICIIICLSILTLMGILYCLF